ncbi:hypothetical protein M426DRAFT_8033 [Hypoxylon sp. CI-4A]|nr:hypothetical protein M426DRAFT_8033 [Hypoxylon sp. CI-4A]
MPNNQDQHKQKRPDIIEEWTLPPPNLPPLFVWRSQDPNLLKNYRGDLKNPKNRSENIPDEKNTSLFLYNLPPRCTTAQLLASLQGVGKIYFSSINPPSGKFHTSAAKVTFWDRQGADNLLSLISKGQFFVGGFRAKACMNRIRVSAQEESLCSRVILIRGPSNVVSMANLHRFFAIRFYYELESYFETWNWDGTTSIEIRFSSYRAQASCAWRLLFELQKGIVSYDITPKVTLEELRLFSHMYIEWGRDPCEYQGNNIPTFL